MNNEMVLIESKTMRSQHTSRVEVLDKVGQLAMLPGDSLTSVTGAAEYFGVPVKTLQSLITDNKDELEENGLTTLQGDELRDLKAQVRELTRPGQASQIGTHATSLTSQDSDSPLKPESNPVLQVGSKARSLTVLPRKAVLNLAMLLRDSDVARQIRGYLLEVEEVAQEQAPEVIDIAIDRMASRMLERKEYKTLKRYFILAGWSDAEFRAFQSAMYERALGMTATEIRHQPQTSGTPLKRGEGFRKSTVAKDHFDDDQREMIGDLTNMMLSIVSRRFPSGVKFTDAMRVLDQSTSLLVV